MEVKQRQISMRLYSFFLVIAAICIASGACMYNIEFSQHPSNLETIVNQVAMFQCEFIFNDSSNERPDAAIRWFVNSVSVINNMSPPCQADSPPTRRIGTTNGNTNKVFTRTLTITASKECSNQAEVYCDATLYHRINDTTITTLNQTRSNSALLRVQSIDAIKNASLEVYTNGSIKTFWNSIAFNGSLQNISVKYQINITSDIRPSADSHCITGSYPVGEPLCHVFLDAHGNQSLCETFNFSVKPIIRVDGNTRDSIGTTINISQDLHAINSIESGNVTFIENNSLEFIFILRTPMPFCTVIINATDDVSNELYIISNTRLASGATDTISFRVQNNTLNTLSLPFDRLYTAALTLKNRYSMQTVTIPRLSTYSIQSVTVAQNSSNTATVISFAINTEAQGTFVVCSTNNTRVLDGFSYVFARREPNTFEISFDSDRNGRCNMHVYDIKSDGQLQDTPELRPASKIMDQPCIVGCTFKLPSTNIRDGFMQSNITVSVGEGSIIMFVCNISGLFIDNESDLLGCIAIIHINDYSSMIVQKIPKENPTMNVTVDPGKIYPYSIFPWKRSGLAIDAHELERGSKQIPSVIVQFPTSETTEATPSQPTGLSTTGIIVITVFVTIIILIIIAIITCCSIILKRRQKTLSCVKGQTKPDVIEQSNDQDTQSTVTDSVTNL